MVRVIRYKKVKASPGGVARTFPVVEIFLESHDSADKVGVCSSKSLFGAFSKKPHNLHKKTRQ